MNGLNTCSRCGYTTNETIGQCPQCGQRESTARSPKTVRRLGWVQLVLGLFLVGLMGTITWNVAPLMAGSGPTQGGGRFTGTAEQAQLVLGLFGLVIMFGLTSMVNGIWQIRTGRRNKWIFIFMLALTAVLIVVGWLVTKRVGH